ncbi:AbrB/MazE/SpoVT family DNA-binding domain-containing protein [Brevundimonas staleyi]|uniref:AbrB/MazE/SpoVT family DNA-binding domain-containing protein n=1 Tax=Brevundimonas staleyi TaxID=74326 RepID=A0ABW0FMR8_9CAUL
MTVLTVTTKGQVTLKKDVLRHLGIEPGQKVDIDLLPGGRVEVKAARATGSISDVFGRLRREGQPVLTVDDINAIAAKGWAGEL